jgi:hypothetical protein
MSIKGKQTNGECADLQSENVQWRSMTTDRLLLSHLVT